MTEPDPQATTPATFLIVDDHELFRSALRLLLESTPTGHVLEAASGAEALELLRTEPVDLVLLDVSMPDVDGLTSLERMHKAHPEVPVLMLSHFADASYVRSALQRGAAGYVVKGATKQQFAAAIETAVGQRGVYIDPVVARLLLTSDDATPTQLTERERGVLDLLIDGATNDEIAERLFVTEKTVKTHLSAIYRKLGVSNRTQAATKALRDELVAHDGHPS